MKSLRELSEPALDLLKRNMTSPSIAVDSDTRNAYGELASAGLMVPLHIPLGRDSAYRMTQEGVDVGRALVGRCGCWSGVS
jgi:hypothetical protein